MANKKRYPKEDELKIPYFDAFIKRYSGHNVSYQRNKLIQFALYLEKVRKKTVLTATVEDVKDFFEKDIDIKRVLREVKAKWRNTINQYYEYVKEISEKIDGKPFMNPVPSAHLFDFSEQDTTMEKLEKEEDLLTYEVAEKILNHLYFTNIKMFIVVSLLLYTGARISEVCGIKIENVDLDERYILVKVKGKKLENRWGVYFFPIFFRSDLDKWIQGIQLENPDAIYLFAYQGSALTTKTPRAELRDIKALLNLKCKVNPHAFRDFLNTKRFEAGVSEEYRCLLLNQTPAGVNPRHYLKKYQKRIELLKIYDKTFPFPEFKPKMEWIK